VSVISVGVDLVSIPRIERLLHNKGDAVLLRLLTDSERSYCLAQPRPARHVAARLAAKEAAYKAFQADQRARAVGWRETEVIRDSAGRPDLRFHGRAAQVMERLRACRALLSLSHTDENAIAVVILAGD
jgi:holo-[acyl-carrier protein] synthase